MMMGKGMSYIFQENKFCKQMDLLKIYPLFNVLVFPQGKLQAIQHFGN